MYVIINYIDIDRCYAYKNLIKLLEILFTPNQNPDWIQTLVYSSPTLPINHRFHYQQAFHEFINNFDTCIC